MLAALCALWCTAIFAQATTPSYTVSSGSVNYTDLSSYTEVPLGDDELSAPISPAGFSFNYFGATQTSFRIGSNGYILFGSYILTTNPKPDHQTAGNSVSPFWTDLMPTKSSAGHEIGYRFGAGILVVEWYNIFQRYSGPGLFNYGVRMQVWLYTGTGVIECRWDTPTTFQTYGATSADVDCVAISAQPGIVPHEIIDGFDSGYVKSDGSVTAYPAKRYIRFTPVNPPSGPTINTTSPLPNGIAGQAYSQQFAASGGTTPYGWTATGLPSGWTMSASGLLSAPGASVNAGTYNFTVTVTDASSNFDTDPFSVTINPPALVITTTSPLPPGTAGQAYSQQFAATGGVSPYTWSATGLPTGWSMSASGLLSAAGANVVAGTYNFTVTVTDSASPAAQDSDPFSVTIVAAGSPLTISTTSPLPSGTDGVAYAQQFNATGGAAPYTWSATGLPTGWAMNASGLLSASAANVVAGTYNFTVTVTDSASPAAQDSDPFSVTINAPPALNITTATLANGSVGAPYAATITAQNGSGGYTWAIVSGSLPPGITGIPGSGTPSIGLSGTPTSPGTYNFTVQVTDSSSNTDTQAFTIVISLAGGGFGLGGGGGGGCQSDESHSWWLLMAAFALLAVAHRRVRA
jgi:heme exporter protein D